MAGTPSVPGGTGGGAPINSGTPTALIRRTGMEEPSKKCWR